MIFYFPSIKTSALFIYFKKPILLQDGTLGDALFDEIHIFLI